MSIEEQIENAVARGWTRVGLVPVYRSALVAEDAGAVVDWERINAAILTRFKKSGLAAIRDAAWWRAAKPEAVA